MGNSTQMKKIFVVLSFLSGIFVFSQRDINFSGSKIVEDLWFKNVFSEKITDVQGSPYHISQFHPAVVTGIPEQVMMRYNIFHDNIEFSKDDKIQVLPKDQLYKSVLFLVNNEKVDFIDNGYYFHVYQGKNYQLYKKRKIKFQKFVKATSGYTEDKPAKFINAPDEYYLLANNRLAPISKNPKSFAALIPEKKDQILRFLKENKLKLNSEDDLKAVMRFIDQ